MGGRYFPQEEDRELEGKIYWFFAILILGLVLLLIRAWHLQVNEGAYYLGLSENNRLRVIETAPPRGRIYDRNGALLVNNVPSFNLYVVLGDIEDRDAVFSRLLLWVDLSREEISTRLSKRKSSDPYKPIKIKEDLSMTEVARIEGHSLQLPGIKIEAEFKRDAVWGPLAAHLLGYVGEITPDQLKKKSSQGLKSGAIIGKNGVEQSYDEILLGTSGEKTIEVDVLGHERQVVEETLPRRGNDVFLTLDLHTQQVAETALGDKPGAIIALDPNNGDVLAMVSHPTFNPNQMSGGISTATWKSLSQNKERPLTNRVTQGQYPPGSTFKIIVGAALLETETVQADQEINCKGSLRFGDRTFRDWKRWGHGKVSLYRSLVESCDVYYYQFGKDLGVDGIAKYAQLFGLGQPTGIDLAYEKGGLIPSTAWKKKKLKEPWYPGETLSVSIGQGYVSATPLQLATMIAAVSNKGLWYRPRLLNEVRDKKTGKMKQAPYEPARQIPISEKTLSSVQAGLLGVVTEQRGTAHKSRSRLVSMAGKTGTSQVVGRESLALNPETGKELTNLELPKKLQDHALFVVYAPVENPKIAVAVIVEHGGHGGSAAAPLARQVIDAYLFPEEGTHRQNQELRVQQ